MGRNIWLDGMMGLIVGDALGVPVQFMEKEKIITRKGGPVKDMESGGAYNMPVGTWSDDGSMALATLGWIYRCAISHTRANFMKPFYTYS